MLNKNVMGILIVVLVLVALAAGAFWWFFLDVKEKAVTGLSYFDTKITVQINDEVLEVDPYDNFDFTLTTDQPITFVAKDEDGEVILEDEFEVGREAAVIVQVLSPEGEDNGQCMIEANVTDVYYIDEDTRVSEDYVGGIYGVTVLSDKAVNFFNHQFGSFGQLTNTYLYPGHYSIDELPDEIDADQSIRGIFPVDCDTLDNDEDLRDQVYAWRYFEEGAYDDLDWDSLLEDEDLGLEFEDLLEEEDAAADET